MAGFSVNSGEECRDYRHNIRDHKKWWQNGKMAKWQF